MELKEDKLVEELGSRKAKLCPEFTEASRVTGQPLASKTLVNFRKPASTYNFHLPTTQSIITHITSVTYTPTYSS